MVPLTGDIRKVRRRLSCANFEAIRPDVRLHCTALKGGGAENAEVENAGVDNRGIATDELSR